MDGNELIEDVNNFSQSCSKCPVGNILFIESPGVGFSYSNTTEDYMSSGDKMTAEDMYSFLRKWFERYPVFKGRDFFMTGESYAGYYVPELVDILLRDVKGSRDSTPMMNLKGIMWRRRRMCSFYQLKVHDCCHGSSDNTAMAGVDYARCGKAGWL